MTLAICNVCRETHPWECPAAIAVEKRGECEALKLDGKPCKMKRGMGWVSGAGFPKARYLCPGHWRSPPKRFKMRPILFEPAKKS